MKVMITIPVSTTKKYNPDILPDSFNIQQISIVTLSFWHYINNKRFAFANIHWKCSILVFKELIKFKHYQLRGPYQCLLGMYMQIYTRLPISFIGKAHITLSD